MALSSQQAGVSATAGRGNLKPRFRVFVGPGGMQNVGPDPNILVTFPLSANILKNNFFSADRFQIVCSLYADPTQSVNFWAPHGEGNGGLGDGMNVKVEITFEGYPGVGWVQVFRGYVDKMILDSHRGTVTLTGRNFSALILDSQQAKIDLNKPVADVVTELAHLHNLKGPDWGPTGPPEGTFGTTIGKDTGNATTASGSPNTSEGQALTQLATFTGRQATVNNDTLYFGVSGGAYWNCQYPTPDFADQKTPGIGGGHTTKLGPSNSIALKFTHDFQFTSLPQLICVNYIHNAPGKQVVKVGEDAETDNQKRYFMEVWGMTEENATTYAKNIHNVMNYREWLIEWKVAGPDLLTATVQDYINVVGSDSFLDGEYAVVAIEYDISFERGFTQTLKGVWGKTEGLGGTT